MDISKAYNNKILNSIKQNINHILDYNMISKIYHKFPLINCISLEDNYKLSSYTRLISKKNLSHQQFINEIPDLIDFALKYEHNNIFIKDKINSLLMNKYFPKKWNDMLILYDLKFISFIFLQYFENECDTLIILISNDKKIKINIAYSKNDYNETKINKIIYHLINIIEWFKHDSDNEININILLSPFKKTFQYKFNEQIYKKYPWLEWTKKMDNNCICPFHINTGVSWGNTITLFRIDEIFKVLLHELIHNLDHDYKEDINENILNNNLNFKIGNNSYPVIINEAYTEYIAILYWNYYLINYYYLFNSSTKIDKLKLYYHMINRELLNSALLCKKLFIFYNINNLKILNKTNDLEQKTNAFSYIFIKYILLKNLIDFTNGNTYENALEINKLLQKELNNIDKYNYLLNIQPDKNMKLRLSIHELNI